MRRKQTGLEGEIKDLCSQLGNSCGDLAKACSDYCKTVEECQKCPKPTPNIPPYKINGTHKPNIPTAAGST